MNNFQDDHLTSEEKTLIAMGAAIGGGCRTCSEKLYAVATSQKIPPNDMLKAFLCGLDARTEAIKTMKTKISTLIGDDKAIGTDGYPQKLATLTRIASFAAANSAPDVLAEATKARAQGATDEQLQICISLAKMIRKNAGAFSDQEISEKVTASAPCEKATCCSVPSDSKNAQPCSCG
jgi:hypothetical protein